MMNAVLLTYVLVVGACIGSFLNVVIARLPVGESIVRPRSRCPACGHMIRWYDNIPLLSYIVFLRGRCRGCKAPIALRYPLVELLMALLSAALWLQFGWSFDFLVWWPLLAALMALTYLDIDHWWIPDVIVIPAGIWALCGAFFPGRIGITDALLGLLPSVFLWLVGLVFERITGKEGMGLGDIKLLMVLGLALGFFPTMTVLVLASLQGALVGIMVNLFGGHLAQPEQKNPPTQIPQADADNWTPPPGAFPFGPFLTLATFEVLLLPVIFGNFLSHLVTMISGAML